MGILCNNKLADGSEYMTWERPCSFSKTYHVAGNNPEASDKGPGTEKAPFRTIGRAAEVLEAGERVVIHEGVYRESVSPVRGGSGPEKMISYEAAKGESVVVKGSIVVESGWSESKRWQFRKGIKGNPKVWELKLDGSVFGGYNPFGMVNLLGDFVCVPFKHVPYESFFLRRGMVFVDGKPLKQVKTYSLLGTEDGAFWVEHSGLVLHIRFKDDTTPHEHTVEITVKEQVFAPQENGLGYICVKGITFEHAGNGNPVPQRGVLSTGRGHHWIIEDCTVQWANSVGIDAGNECWNAAPPKGEFSEHIIRRNTVRQCGVCGLAAYMSHGMLVEDNLFEYIGWQRSYYASESAGIKVHRAKEMMFRRNVVRHIEECAGLWLDGQNVNCRITGNIFADMPESFHALQMEANRQYNMVDNNIIWGIGAKMYKERISTPDGTGWFKMDKNPYGCGIYSQGTDELTIVNNLFGDCNHSGFHADTVPYRLHDGRGGTARDMKIYNNIFYNCREAAIDFDNEHNSADGNLYIDMYEGGGYLRILNPDPAKWLDLEAWRRFYGWDLNGDIGDSEITFDVDKLVMTVINKNTVHKVDCYKWLKADYSGTEAGEKRSPGPFEDLTGGFINKNIDPRVHK